MEELATKYSFKDIEEKHYHNWEKQKFFHAEKNPQKEKFSIVIPPPNVTGILHMGHALNNTIQDILIRYKKLSGCEALWMPGTDHAGIATQNVVERKLAKQKLSRQDVGREKFLEHVWDWKQEYGSTIIRQLKRLGCACDWDRVRFTMDEDYSEAVLEVFIRLYEKGLIYRGYYIINWCPRCETALSDEEAPHKDTAGFLYHIKYPIKGTKEFLTVATTRPETMLGDTAVAVNPKDERYKNLVGKMIILPLMEREIPIIADELVDMEFGTGAVKVTPAHDPNDYIMGKRHDLEFINILHPNGICNENAGDYAGSDRFEAREAVVEDLKERKLLVKIEPHQHAVGHCYRCHSVVEPYYSKQWFVKMKPLSVSAQKAVEEGEIKFYPERWTKVYLNWMENIQDWCISRQIWWGHRLPVYYCRNCEEEGSQNINDKSQITNKKTRGVIVARERPEKCPDCGSKNIIQDEDVLDTWFSSWLWPFATFGWPFHEKTEDRKQKTADRKRSPDLEKKKEELDYFYPTSVLVTAPEIIFFWVARMIMAGFEFRGKKPFSDVYIHGTVRDDTGKKMSKSLGNSIDPLEIIAQYGTDALRFSLISITSMGQDVYLAKEKFEFGRNFCNKIWNASRFLLMNIDREAVKSADLGALKNSDFDLCSAWILSRFNSTILKLAEAIEKYRLNEAAGILYEFFWHEFCDWYIEMAKLDMKNSTTQAVLYEVLEKSLRLMHPFMPFITEEIWQKMTQSEASIMRQNLPLCDENRVDPELEAQMLKLQECVTVIRNLRSERNISPKENVEVRLEDKPGLSGFIGQYAEFIKSLARVENINFVKSGQPPAEAVATGTFQQAMICIVGNETVDKEEEILKIEKQIREISGHIKRKDQLLSNQNYLKKAPAEVVEKEKSSRRLLQDELDKLNKIKNAFEK